MFGLWGTPRLQETLPNFLARVILRCFFFVLYFLSRLHLYWRSLVFWRSNAPGFSIYEYVTAAAMFFKASSYMITSERLRD